jgi:hypothetical protein
VVLGRRALLATKEIKGQPSLVKRCENTTLPLSNMNDSPVDGHCFNRAKPPSVARATHYQVPRSAEPNPDHGATSSPLGEGD